MNRRGVTVIELLVVTAIIGALAIALGYSYTGWQGSYRIEKEIKDIYSDLMFARSRAMTTGRMQFARCTSPHTSYTLYDDDGNGTTALPAGDGVGNTSGRTDTVITGFPKTIEYALTWGVGTGLGHLQFHKNGTIDTSAAGTAWNTVGPWTIRIAGYDTSSVSPDYDCIEMTPTRLNMGKWSSVCDAK